jgi:hypothetical protein
MTDRLIVRRGYSCTPVTVLKKDLLLQEVTPSNFVNFQTFDNDIRLLNLSKTGEAP